MHDQMDIFITHHLKIWLISKAVLVYYILFSSLYQGSIILMNISHDYLVPRHLTDNSTTCRTRIYISTKSVFPGDKLSSPDFYKDLPVCEFQQTTRSKQINLRVTILPIKAAIEFLMWSGSLSELVMTGER